ncbi:MAG: hypothetical protein QOI06_2127 [Nocardioidaceae bacterium]|nr:hypothetical protein [Nocardioidaceae bacterium]
MTLRTPSFQPGWRTVISPKTALPRTSTTGAPGGVSRSTSQVREPKIDIPVVRTSTPSGTTMTTLPNTACTSITVTRECRVASWISILHSPKSARASS